MIRRLLDMIMQRPSTPTKGGAHADATTLVRKMLDGELRRLSDRELVALIQHMLDTPATRAAMHGNEKYLASIARNHGGGRPMSMKQRNGLYNILERAMPHNVVAALLRPRD